MPHHAEGPFEVKMNPLPSDGGSEAVALGRMALDKRYRGDLEATSVGQMLALHGDATGSAGYVAIERIRGTLHGRSGEFGHMCVEPGGLPCKCGRRGCLEAYCSATRLTEVSGVTLREFFLGVECGNSAYRTLLDDYLRHLAIGIHNIRLALDCDVVLGGFMAKFLEPYLPQLRDQLAQLDPFDAAGAYLHLSRYPKHAALIGAALYFVKQFLDQV